MLAPGELPPCLRRTCFGGSACLGFGEQSSSCPKRRVERNGGGGMAVEERRRGMVAPARLPDGVLLWGPASFFGLWRPSPSLLASVSNLAQCGPAALLGMGGAGVCVRAWLSGSVAERAPAAATPFRAFPPPPPFHEISVETDVQRRTFWRLFFFGFGPRGRRGCSSKSTIMKKQWPPLRGGEASATPVPLPPPPHHRLCLQLLFAGGGDHRILLLGDDEPPELSDCAVLHDQLLSLQPLKTF